MSPLDYIWIALVLTFCTLSVYNLTREGMLLESARTYVNKFIEWFAGLFYSDCQPTKKNILTKYLSKPFFECPPCMASVWGTIFYWSIFTCDIKTWIVCVLISSILNKIIYGYVE